MFGVLAFGDSITFGRGVLSDKGWADKLKDYFESEDFFNAFYNLGIPGDTSTDLLRRFETELKARVNYYHPDNKFVTLIAIGTNDSKGLGTPENLKTNPDDYSNNLLKIVKIAKKETKDIVLISLPPVDESLMPFENTYFSNKVIREFNDIIERIAKKEGLLFCDVFSDFINQKNYESLFADGVHPNEKGYDFIYGIIKKFLIENKIL